MDFAQVGGSECGFDSRCPLFCFFGVNAAERMWSDIAARACLRKIYAKLSSASSQVRLFKRMKHQMMKKRQLLGLLLAAGLLCSCASSAPYSETMIDTSTQNRHAVLPDAPPQPPLTYQPGATDSGPGFGPPGH